MSATTYLPADRVRVVRNGQLYPWTPPPPEPAASAALRGEAYAKALTKPYARRKGTRRTLTVLAIAPNGRPTHYQSIEAAARATRVCAVEIKRQCKGLNKAPRMAYRFQYSGGIR